MNVLRKSVGILLGKRPPALQVGALCLDGKTGQVMLITSRGTGRWIIPKGWPMAGVSLPGAARREAWEEGGIEGRISDKEIGRYMYDKEQDNGFAVPVEVRVYALYVTSLTDDYPEVHQRERRWFSPGKSAELVAEPGLKDIIRSLSTRPQET
ncbi:8-oxo-dGTP pyrophosphatase MutT, NUDIX family [Paracoccus alcaliphilus]|uniref:8-oxo-dGTP pyrophosphatase MutT, NUDIX family n=1 Tax=Paracoccus alcaliphilus TaxID=34002 RepID=A0A1H8KJP1_9RHOB|nr:NUDIX hydrolase [Paracoccus alcaliphilus]WCR18975.1 NUDIX hydrolase [Paracoccus alcaliphilus]SEN93104.1 8-oxo-dGTP pyrophosphatase MutT, NUDIX family [Paracoccus alcaliphilus]